jgi:parallel beta-helix repeat protein
MIVDLPYPNLTGGNQYAIVLTAETINENGLMHGYSWPTREVAGNEKFGKYSGGQWVDESFLGDGWLKVYTQYVKQPPVPTTLNLSPAYVNMMPGETVMLQAEVLDQYGEPVPDAAIAWSSEDITVAEVVYGEVRAIGNGTAVITADASGIQDSVIVTVSDADGVVPEPGMVITEDTTLRPGIYDFSSGQGLIIGADDIVLDGSGAVLIGPGSLDRGPASFKGTAVYSDGHSGVTVKNLTAKGFQTGLHVKNGEQWTITGNNFSDNYTNPDYGWGDGEIYSAVLLESVHDSVIAHNRGNNVWNGLHLRHSNRNEVKFNDFSHTSNVSLKMWNASENVIRDNNFGYGIRIAPGEVHARDSTSMLMESGSNNNRILRNDFTHGGDGIFIRVLNGWVSTGNYFEENDTSYANNNAIESWSPGNTYVRNIANYSSYGFWLGGSDNTVLIGNIVRYNGGYNGESRNNAPEDFGNAGIAVVNGASSHFVMVGNDIQYNNGPGVAIRYKADDPAHHWIIQNNTIRNNKNDPRGYKGYGIYIRNADWLDIAGNDISDNDADPIYIDSNVSDVFIREAAMGDPIPEARATISSRTVAVGQEVVFDASGSTDPAGLPLHYRWNLGDGTIEGEAVVRHAYEQPGFYRVGLTVNNGKLADLAFFNVYVHDRQDEVGTDAPAAEWGLVSADPDAVLSRDTDHVVQGGASIRVSAERGTNHQLIYPAAKNLNLDAGQADTLSFWLKYNAEYASDTNNKKPVVRLHQDEANYFEYTPSTAYLEQLHAPVSEQRYEWKPIEIDLTGNDPIWTLRVAGSPTLSSIQYITIDEGPSRSGISDFWIDALHIYKKDRIRDYSVNIAKNPDQEGDPQPIASASSDERSDPWAPLLGTYRFAGSATPRWIPDVSADPNDKVWYGVDFGEERVVNRVDVYFYHNPSGTPSQDTEWKPDAFTVEYWTGKHWKRVNQASAGEVKPNRNTVAFQTVHTSKLRVVLTPHRTEAVTAAPSIYGFAAFNTENIAGNAFGEEEPTVAAVSSESLSITLEKLEVWVNRKGTELTDMIVEIYPTADGLPAGTPLKTVTVPLEEVNFGGVTTVEIGLTNLEPGKTYAVALTQATLAPNGTYDHYRWPTRNIGVDESFGKYVGGRWVDESFLGTGWLKLHTSRGLIDYSFPNPGGTGYGVGHLDEAKRWQTFTLPADRVWHAIDGSIRPDNGWIAADRGERPWIEIRWAAAKSFNTALIYFGEDAARGIAVPVSVQLQAWNGSGWTDVKRIGPPIHSLQAGFNTFRFQQVTTDRFRVLVDPQEGTQAELKELELMHDNGPPIN